jgi:hypothetical protein
VILGIARLRDSFFRNALGAGPTQPLPPEDALGLAEAINYFAATFILS